MLTASMGNLAVLTAGRLADFSCKTHLKILFSHLNRGKNKYVSESD